MLVALDRSSSERLVITHEFLAALLGCSRSVMTTTLGELENRGGIRTGRGKIEVIDRHVLRDTACAVLFDDSGQLRQSARAGQPTQVYCRIQAVRSSVF
jgi:hypothetical protein